MDYLIMEAVAVKAAQEEREEQKQHEIKRWKETRGRQLQAELGE